MFPSLEGVRQCCRVSEAEESLLTSPEAPIVLLSRSPDCLAPAIAPANPNLGVMLPYSPLHHLLLRDLNFAVVATSGNLSDEPICINENEALGRLRDVADLFLVHDRSIVRHVDDSILRIIAGRGMMLRRARGYAPLPIMLRQPQGAVLAVGAHLKNTVALSVGRNVFVSQHIGDLATKSAYDAFASSVADLPRLYEAKPEVVAHDLHPEYLSTKYALQYAGKRVGVQHHWAHIASCMAENEIGPPLLGVAWDGTGYGTDGTVWGGEFFLVQEDSCRRAAHLRTFRLPGGDAAVQEPRRSALGLLHEILGDELWKQRDLLTDFAEGETKVLRSMLTHRVNSPITSSAGRLFDGVAALIGLGARNTFEGQAAMALEFAATPGVTDGYAFALRETEPVVVDWEPALRALLDDRGHKVAVGVMAARFHNLLANTILAIARRCDQPKVVLSGGCFQNRYLAERVTGQLLTAGFQPYWHQLIPPNDGGIALGQLWLSKSPIRELA
jgi:hydrogenase maturation protein HypF